MHQTILICLVGKSWQETETKVMSDMVSLYVLTVTDTIISTSRRHEILSMWNTAHYNQILDERGNVKSSVWQYK